MRSTFIGMLSLLALGTGAAVGCSSSDSSTPLATPDDASVPDGASPPSSNDAGPSDGGLTDGPPVDDGKPFCKTAAAAGAAFCADFEETTNVDDGWNDTTASGGATLAFDTNIARQKRSAAAKFVSNGGANGTAAFSTVVNASGTKSKMAIEFDGRVSFPNGPPPNNTLFLTLALRTGTGPTGHFFIDIERGAGGWKLLPTGGSEKAFPAFGEEAWHHFRLSYDGTGGQAEINLFIDNVGVASISSTKGPPPGGAPATFDNVLIEHLGLEGNTTASFHIDNVVVLYP